MFHDYFITISVFPTYRTDSNSPTSQQKIFDISSTFAQRQFRLIPNTSVTLSYQ